jgi:hypothetical protein
MIVLISPDATREDSERVTNMLLGYGLLYRALEPDEKELALHAKPYPRVRVRTAEGWDVLSLFGAEAIERAVMRYEVSVAYKITQLAPHARVVISPSAPDIRARMQVFVFVRDEEERRAVRSLVPQIISAFPDFAKRTDFIYMQEE